MSVNIYFEGSGRVQIPVNPETIYVTLPGNNTKATVLELGEINILRTPGLKTVSFSSFFPAPGTHFDEGAQSIASYVKYFEQAMTRKRSLRFVVAGFGTPINLKVSIEAFEHGYEGGDEDCHYSLKMLQYRSYAAITAQIQAPTNPAPPSSGSQSRDNPNKSLSVGATVKVTGRLHKDSYGTGPGATENGATRKVHLISKGAPYPIHVTTTDGGWRGWVSESACEVI